MFSMKQQSLRTHLFNFYCSKPSKTNCQTLNLRTFCPSSAYQPFVKAEMAQPFVKAGPKYIHCMGNKQK